jgi:hypothetical protein
MYIAFKMTVFEGAAKEKAEYAVHETRQVIGF